MRVWGQSALGFLSEKGKISQPLVSLAASVERAEVLGNDQPPIANIIFMQLSYF